MAPDGKVLEQHRAKGKADLRVAAGTCLGPASWIFRQAQAQSTVGDSLGLLQIRAGYLDVPSVQRHLVWYAERYGTAQLPDYLTATLQRARPKWKDKISDYNGF